MYEYILKKDKNNKLVLFKNVKGLFGKFKEKKVDGSELFTYSRKSVKEGFYSISPSIDGLSLPQYLELKASYLQALKFSDFGQRTIWKFDLKDETCDKQNVDGKDVFNGKLVGDISVYDTHGNLMLQQHDYPFAYTSYTKITPGIAQFLLQNACNGIYQSARDTEATVKERIKSEYGEDAKVDMYVCEECGEKFESLDAFYCHLIENKHYDSIFDSHPYDVECQRVKALASKENK